MGDSQNLIKGKPMKNGKEFRSNYFARNPRFKYLPPHDRYLFALPESKWCFNVIGAGMIGVEHIITTMLEGRGTIHGLYDPNRSSIETAIEAYQRFKPGEVLVVYDSLADACMDEAVDGLLVCTPNFTHIEVIRQAICSGKHILLEKPMATTIADAWEMLQLAKDYPSVFQVGLQYRYKPIYVEAIHEALERRSLGELQTISIMEHRIPFLDKVGQWNKFSKYSGGTLVEKCCHYFDLMNLFSGSKPERVFATGSMAVNFKDFVYRGERSDIIDNAFVNVEYENSVRASFNLCMFAPLFFEELILCGNSGRLSAHERVDFVKSEGSQMYLEVMRGEQSPARISRPSYPFYIDETGHDGSTYIEHIHFIDNIEGQKTNSATVEEGFWSIVVGVAAEESVQTGEVVRIDELLARNGVPVDLHTVPRN